MIQSEMLLPSWQPCFVTTSPLNVTTPYDQVMDFSSSFLCPEESSTSSYVPTMFPDEFLDLENVGNEISGMEGLESISGEEMEDICEWINGYDMEMEGDSTSFLKIEGNNEWSPCPSQDSSQNSTTPAIPVTDISMIDDQLTRLLHLFKAYGEAMENGQKELAEVIVKSISEKSNPIGNNVVERVAYNLFLSRQEQSEYIRVEAYKNFTAALKVLCQSLPNSRFAHFTATSAILECMPDDAARIRVMDFHMGEGIQWALLIEGLRGKQKQVWVTSVKSEEGCDDSCWKFEDTKKRLSCHARQHGVELQMEEKSIGDLCNELMEGMKGEWMVFNCMVGLPHMAVGGRRRKKSVGEFLKVAKEVIKNGKGIVVVGDGEAEAGAGESLKGRDSYSSYFESLLRHYEAVFESLETKFPVYLTEARTALENLFLSPLMCPEAWFQEWKEMKMKGYESAKGMELKGVKHSEESFRVAKQLVNEGEGEEENCGYKVKMSENEMVLQWKDTPLVRVCTWTSSSCKFK